MSEANGQSTTGGAPPVLAALPALRAALAARREAVLVAPPGAGKTTRAPLALLEEDWARAGKLIVLSPRRVAARAAAAHMARLVSEAVGETIGYRVRLDSKISTRTRIEVVTEGVFTRMILDDPELSGVAGVLFDEFHERSLEGDLGLALARDAQTALRPDLRLLVMSATLDADRVAKLLNDAPVVVSEGRMFPVETRYRARDARAPLEAEVASAVRAALAADDGSVLVFLPGMREIERVAALLAETIYDSSVDIRPLYGALSGADQDAAIAPAPLGRRKVVLATSIAETSLTIEGVRIVVDCGLTRRPRYEPGLGLTRLETVRASQASITQRAGRAGRLSPGVCWRLWSEGETRALPAFDRPEILESDLTGLALDLASWGARDPQALTWLDAPAPAAWSEAQTTLKRLKAIDEDGALTAHGKLLARLPLPPRLAHMAAFSKSDAGRAAEIAMLLTEQGLGGRSPNLDDRLHNFERDRSARAQAARAMARRVAKMAGGEDGDASSAGLILSRAFPERVAKARGGGAFVMANGRAASLDLTEKLAGEAFLAIAETSGAADRARILSAAPLTLKEIEAAFANEITQSASVSFDAETGAARARRVRRLGRLVLSEGPVEQIPAGEYEAALLEAVRERGLEALDWDERARRLRARVGVMRALEGGDWPDWSAESLLEGLDAWLGPALTGARKLGDVDVAGALKALLPYDLSRRLETEAPDRFETPAGGEPWIDYEAQGGPALDVRLQELFGMDNHPAIANGRIRLTLRLLSPAGRPVQTTQDLPGFWRGSYASVRADMRGRYPKHPWPEDPLGAPPTRRAKPKGT